MTIRRVTGFLVLGASVALVLWDLFAVGAGGVQASISAVVTEHAYARPALPFAIGFVCGHWFWGAKPSAPPGVLGTRV